jgi:hypothetical protein
MLRENSIVFSREGNVLSKEGGKFAKGMYKLISLGKNWLGGNGAK